MPINIQNIINQLEAKLTAADSNTSSNESLRLINLIEQINGSGGILEYQFPNQLPPVDSAQIGKLAYVRETDFYYDSSGLLGHFPKYYFAANDSDGWSEFDMNAKLSADSDYQAYIASLSSSAGGAAAAAWVFQGSISGYTSGGAGQPVWDIIDKFPFAADGNATDVGDLTVARYAVAGQSSAVSGYSSGGYAPGNVNVNTIDKFPFAADGNATDVGDLTRAGRIAGGQSSSTSGYAAGGDVGGAANAVNTIDKFPFVADANATDVGDLTQAVWGVAGQSSTVSGYASSGYSWPNVYDVINKFPFSSDGNATDVGDLTQGRYGGAGQSSDVSGYTSAGYTGIPFAEGGESTYNIIDKFPFATDANATDVGDLTRGVSAMPAGQSSTISGYTSGGSAAPGSDIIDKFPFATDANATDVGDLTLARNGSAGQQV